MVIDPNDPKCWLGRAEELRALAENLKAPDTKAMILGWARDYVALAERAENHLEWPESSRC
jgi:hypothetical protein